jgi:asparagine synthase (glutamine-hydrolysing)
MCGIAGVAGYTPSIDVTALLAKMCGTLAHRGPDAQSFWMDNAAALGHRRLSIIDLTTGNQPMANEDGSLQVVFNGEIYNYRELKADLAAQGHRFLTNSDTEVLLHLYERYGEEMPKYLNGMFAFAIWDTRRRQLFLARDRVGKKPLYYTESIPGIGFAFASELKALSAIPGFPDEEDPFAIADFLALSYIPDPRTVYAKVRKLEPAHTLTWKSRGIHLSRYWAPAFGEICTKSHSEAVEAIRSLAADAVSRRMISDVPLGAFLSGGVDSSAVVAFMARQATSPVRTFSIGFPDKRYDESEYARNVARDCRTEHHEWIVMPKIGDVLEFLGRHMDEPFADSSIVPTLYLAKMTRRHVTVALSGDGADEVFGGYRRYRFGVIEERLRRRFPTWFRQTAVAWLGRNYPKFDYLPQVLRAKSMLINIAAETGDAYFSSMTGFRDGGLQAILSSDLRQSLAGYDPRAGFRERFTAVRHLQPLEQMQSVDFDTYLPGDILVKMDRATMAHSLEARSPWLDHRLVDLACSLPAHWKLRRQIGKAILKDAVRPYIPSETLSRRKMGFAVPLAHWFRTSLKPVFESQVLTLDGAQYLSLAETRRLWKEHQAGFANHDRKLWSLLMLTLWQKNGRSTGRLEELVGSA